MVFVCVHAWRLRAYSRLSNKNHFAVVAIAYLKANLSVALKKMRSWMFPLLLDLY